MLHSNCKNMPINFLPLIGAGVGALQQSKQESAIAGIKTYTKPKTIFGKLIGGVSGRTAAYNTQEELKGTQLTPAVMNSIQPKSYNTDPNMRQQIPLTGGISFGGEAGKKTYLPFAIVAAVVAVFYFMRNKKGGRRRY